MHERTTFLLFLHRGYLCFAWLPFPECEAYRREHLHNFNQIEKFLFNLPDYLFRILVYQQFPPYF